MAESRLKNLESKLTDSNRESVRKYLHNINDEVVATALLKQIDMYDGQPLNNAFYLHNLTELELLGEKGYDFVNSAPTPELREEFFYTNRDIFLKATMLHCEYLQLKAQEAGHTISLRTMIELDPFSSREDKDEIFGLYPDLKVEESEKNDAKRFLYPMVKLGTRLSERALSFRNYWPTNNPELN
jgi:hypothetical protein